MPTTGATSRSRSEIPVVLTQGLTKVFKDFWMRSRVKAVDGLDMEIQQGEIFGLLGPNGSGKSTTIKILLGLLHKTSGFVAVFGKPPTDVAVKKRIGVLPEESYLYPFLNARETLEYYGKLFQLDHRSRKRRTEELLDMVGLTAVAHRQVREYSKGMQRRIGIAQALINDPELLILDEPTTGLDPIGSKQIKDLILELGRRGKTVLLSSHLLADVEECVDRMIILYGGKKRAEGTCDELLTARTRMTIETDVLTDEVVEEIDRLLRDRAGVAVRRIAKPRQRLEDLFMDIVERARTEQVETHGAQHGGSTAAFLIGQDGDSGEALIDRLVAAPDDLAEGDAGEKPARAADESADDQTESVIDSLVGDSAEPEADEPEGEDGAPRREPSPDEPDRSVIDSLLGGGTDRASDDQGKRE